MRTRATMTVSLPPAMIEEVERVRKAEHRTRSELVREALRTYFGAGRGYLPTLAERRAIERGRAEIRRGEYLTLEELRAHVGAVGRKARRKSRRSRFQGTSVTGFWRRSRRCGTTPFAEMWFR